MYDLVGKISTYIYDMHKHHPPTAFNELIDELLLVLDPEIVPMWFGGANSHLGGERPIDVFDKRGVRGVAPAIEALKKQVNQ